jgi:hypothetical protein
METTRSQPRAKAEAAPRLARTQRRVYWIGTERPCTRRMRVEPEQAEVVLIQKNGDSEVEASITEHEVASSKAIGLTYCNIEWRQQPDERRK